VNKIVLPGQGVPIQIETGVNPTWYEKLLLLVTAVNPLLNPPPPPGPDPTKSNVTRSLNAQTGTTYTLALTDAGNVCEFSNASAVTVTVPPNSSVAFPVGTQIDVMAGGAGKVTFAQGSGVTIKSMFSFKSLSAQEAGGTLIQMSANVWRLMGSLVA
jgi:hypothetical protein